MEKDVLGTGTTCVIRYDSHKVCICSYMNLGFYSVYVGGRNESAFTRD